MAQTIAFLVSSYVVVAVLLLNLNLASRWAWPIKAGAIAITTGFFAASYVGAVSLLGWPSRSTLPARFQLLSSKVVEPDKRSGSGGGIYLWVEALDENNVPAGPPRSYELPWDLKVARRVAGAQDKIKSGTEVAGRAERQQDGEQPADETKPAAPTSLRDRRMASGGMDTVPFSDDGQNLQFEDMPAPVMPDKGP
jgi:hypothetical protein